MTVQTRYEHIALEGDGAVIAGTTMEVVELVLDRSSDQGWISATDSKMRAGW